MLTKEDKKFFKELDAYSEYAVKHNYKPLNPLNFTKIEGNIIIDEKYCFPTNFVNIKTTSDIYKRNLFIDISIWVSALIILALIVWGLILDFKLTFSIIALTTAILGTITMEIGIIVTGFILSIISLMLGMLF